MSTGEPFFPTGKPETPPTLERVRARLEGRRHADLEGDSGTRRAAVALLLRERNARNESALEVLFIRRAEREGDPWSGHMAFPGGRHELSDKDLLETALRETREEMGVHLPDYGELLGRLDDVPAMARGLKTGTIVSPFVWLLRETPVFSPNEEVDEVHWASVRALVLGDVNTTIDYPWQGKTLTLPGYQVGPRIVWGLTYKIMNDLFGLVR